MVLSFGAVIVDDAQNNDENPLLDAINADIDFPVYIR